MDQSEIEQAICDVINEICFWINAEEIELNQPLGSMNIDTDEWSFEIIPALEKKIGVPLSADQWSQTGTMPRVV